MAHAGKSQVCEKAFANREHPNTNGKTSSADADAQRIKLTHGAMNPKLQLAKETMKRLRARRCVQRSVVLRLTITEATQLKEMLNAFRRSYDDNDSNRTARMLAYDLGNKLTAAVEKEKQHNSVITKTIAKTDDGKALE